MPADYFGSRKYKNMENFNPLVSVITPTFNSEKFIEKNIQSIVGQDYKNIEHIIIDGGSTDHTIEIIKKYAKNGNLQWITEKDQGPMDAYNKGLKLAKGDIISFLNGDDYYTNGAVMKVVETFYKNPKIDVVYGSCQEYDYKKKKFTIISRINPKDIENITPEDILGGKKALLFQTSMFHRRTIVDKTAPVHIDGFVMELDWWYRMLQNGAKIMYLDKILAIIGQHENRGSVMYAAQAVKSNINYLEKLGRKVPLGARISYLRWKYPTIPNFIKKYFPSLFAFLSELIKKLLNTLKE